MAATVPSLTSVARGPRFPSTAHRRIINRLCLMVKTIISLHVLYRHSKLASSRLAGLHHDHFDVPVFVATTTAEDTMEHQRLWFKSKVVSPAPRTFHVRAAPMQRTCSASTAAAFVYLSIYALAAQSRFFSSISSR